ILLSALETDAKLIRAAREKSPRFYDDHYIDLLCFLKNLRRRAGGELRSKAEALIAARHKVGYMLNVDRKEVLVFGKGSLPVIASMLLLMLGRFVSDWSGWLVDLSEALFRG
ncbi:MAG: hypothetical protein PHP66_09145, partial [Syntrophales bacterium]|nr:hypothetical protein [Syntrophales bacterium]